MYIKLILVFVIVVNQLCSGESLDTRTRPKRLMPIDVSKLGNNIKSLHGLYNPLAIAGQNHISSKSGPKPLNIDLSALKLQQDLETTTAAPEPKSQASDESKDYMNWNDINDMESDNKVEDFEEYDYSQPMRIMPHNVYFHVWSPETPGYDALTDFLHDEYKTGRILSNGKRDNELVTDDWIDNEIPILPDIPPPKNRPVLCSYRLLYDYGITCSQLMTLIGPRPLAIGGNHIVKRNMFLSKGWGPSGLYIKMPSKFETNPIASQANLKKLLNLVKADQVVPKSGPEPRQGGRERPDVKQAINSRRWSIPHLFGSY